MIRIDQNKCDFCGCCVGVCPVDCIEVKEADILIDDNICIDCDICVYICPIEVLHQTGESSETVKSDLESTPD